VSAIGLGTLVAPVLVATVGIPAALVVVGTPLPAIALLGARRLHAIDDRAAVPLRWAPLLREIAIFAPLAPAALETLARAVHEVDVAAGELVFTQGDVGDAFYVVASGAVELDASGTVVAVQERGGWFGEIALLRDVPRTATARALLDSRLLRLERHAFLDAVSSSSASSAAVDAVVRTRLDELRALA
jgi:signal-transduction protein with cAMP-binding, CBS, and nucleotidyltransferase domain